MMEFSWDGREGCLSISRCVQHSSREQKWSAPETRSFSESDATVILDVVEAEILKQILTEPERRGNSHQLP